MVNVFGQFPPSSMNSLLGPEEVISAQRKYGQVRPDEYSFAPIVLGVDPARFGDDRTVIIARQGIKAEAPEILRNARTTEIASRVSKIWDTVEADACFIDDTGGWGAGVIDALIQARFNPIPINFSGSADDTRYYNKRAEMWFEMAEWVRTGGALPPEIEDLVGEMSTPTYTFKSGKFLLQEKDQIKDVLGRSPDIADALALTFAMPVRPRGTKASGDSPAWMERLKKSRRTNNPMVA